MFHSLPAVWLRKFVCRCHSCGGGPPSTSRATCLPATNRSLNALALQVQMGPFKVSPMGFGTWSWVSSSRPLCLGRREQLKPPLHCRCAAGGLSSRSTALQQCVLRQPALWHGLRLQQSCLHFFYLLQGNQFLWGYDESMDPELQEVGGSPSSCPLSSWHLFSDTLARPHLFDTLHFTAMRC